MDFEETTKGKRAKQVGHSEGDTNALYIAQMSRTCLELCVPLKCVPGITHSNIWNEEIAMKRISLYSLTISGTLTL